MITIANIEIYESTREVCNVCGHEVRCSYDANGAHANRDDLVAIRDSGAANWSDEEIFDVAYRVEVWMDEVYTQAYTVAVPEGDGWHELDSIRAFSLEDANQYAEVHYGDQDWYVLDANGENANQ